MVPDDGEVCAFVYLQVKRVYFMVSSLISVVIPIIRIHFFRANPQLHVENVMLMSPQAGLQN